MLGIGADDYGLGERPTIWTPNWNGPQAAGLIYWYAHRAGDFFSLRQPKSVPFTVLSGSRVLPSTDVGPDLGATSQTQSTSGLVVLDTGLPGALDGLTSLTIAYWVTRVVFSGSHSWWGQGDGSTSCFCETNGSVCGPYWRGGSDLRGAFTEVAQVGVTQHLAWTANSTSTKYYRNGVLQQTSANGCGTITAATTYGLYIGGQFSGTGGGQLTTEGRWGDFRVYNRALSDAEIYALYAPHSRWDLYDTSVDYVWSDPVVAGGGTAVPVFYYHLTQQGIA